MTRAIEDTRDRSAKLKIHYNRCELRGLPPAGVRWKWYDVADRPGSTGEMSESVLRKVKGYLTRHDDGTWETSERLETYLQERYGIELEAGDVEDRSPPEPPGEQATLTGAGARDPGTREDTRAIEAGTARSSDSMQVSLTGDQVPVEELEDEGDEDPGYFEAFEKMREGGRYGAGRDPGQSSLSAFNGQVTIGSLRRPTGRVYA